MSLESGVEPKGGRCNEYKSKTCRREAVSERIYILTTSVERAVVLLKNILD
ncbi:hypothetical protein Bca4012_071295 [Brassica carinata]